MKHQDDVVTKTSFPTEWLSVGFIILSIRFVQGWIFWGGGSRRFIYDPEKLDPYSTQWMANKLQSAMPGALLGMQDMISFLLHHFVLLYIAVIIFSLVELLSGIGLILGLFTRLNGLLTAMISVMLMLIFGWEGSACIDEWTMAVANFSIGLTLALSGSSIYSIDNWLLRRFPQLAQRSWFINCASGPWPLLILKRVGIIYLILTLIFTLTTYNYYRGSIFSSYHAGPVSSTAHHMTLKDGSIKSNGIVSFVAYVDGGSPAQPGYIMRVELMNANQNPVEMWEGKQLGELSTTSIENSYSYNRFSLNQYGIVAPVSAKAKIELRPMIPQVNITPGKYTLQVYTIDGKRWDLSIRYE